MYSIAAPVTHEIAPIKGSRFITVAAPIDDETSAQAALDELRAMYPDATHHCSAWRIMRPAIDRSNDDGEPSGSAGRPILAQLTGRDLTNTAIIVVRYFGGTKLGVGGLVRAYGKAASETLDRCRLTEARIAATLSCRIDYSDVSTVEHLVDHHGASISESDYASSVHLTIATDESTVADLRQALIDATAGRIVWLDDNDSDTAVS